MFDIFNDPEWAVLPTHNYLVIQKNGNTYVRDVLREYYKDTYCEESFVPRENLVNPCWTVIRNPHDRFMSGLAYDLWMTGVNLDHAFSDLQNNINSKMPVFFRSTRKVSHTISQVNYILFQPMTFFVDIKDLTAFCQINFGLESTVECKNEVPKDFKKMVAGEICRRNLTQRVNDLLSYETYFYNRLINSSNIWSWQNGNVLGTEI